MYLQRYVLQEARLQLQRGQLDLLLMLDRLGRADFRLLAGKAGTKLEGRQGAVDKAVGGVGAEDALPEQATPVLQRERNETTYY